MTHLYGEISLTTNQFTAYNEAMAHYAVEWTASYTHMIYPTRKGRVWRPNQFHIFLKDFTLNRDNKR